MGSNPTLSAITDHPSPPAFFRLLVMTEADQRLQEYFAFSANTRRNSTIANVSRLQ